MKSVFLRVLVGKHPRRTLLRAVVLAVVCIIVFRFVFRPAWTDGASMEPTIHDGRLHFINLLAYRVDDPQRFDIVAIGRRGDNGKKFMYLKRVLGCPGERIEFRQGTLIVNGVPQEEPHVEFVGEWTMDETALTDDEYFVAGDNRNQRMLFHMAGTTKRRSIVGRLL